MAKKASKKGVKKASTKVAKKAPKKTVKKAPKKVEKKTPKKVEKKTSKKTVKKVSKKPVCRGGSCTVRDNKAMSAAEMETYKARLIALRARIRGDVSTMTDGALSHSRSADAGDLSAMPLHMADIGTDSFEQEQTLAFIQSDSATLKLIEEALARIKDGTYGICEDCGKMIPKVRLNVLPYTACCVQCVELAHQNG